MILLTGVTQFAELLSQIKAKSLCLSQHA